MTLPHIVLFSFPTELSAEDDPVHPHFLAWVMQRSWTLLAFDYHLRPDTVVRRHSPDRTDHLGGTAS